MPSITLNPAGCCIYCGESVPKLTLEHVIPAALSGHIKLPDASCEICQRVINEEIEASYIARVAGPHRHKLGLKSKRTPINPKKSFPITFIYSDGEEEEVYVPSDEWPNVYVFANLEAPPFIKLVPKVSSKLQFIANLIDQEEMGELFRKYRPDARKLIIESHVAHDEFLRLLLKIGTGLLFDASAQSTLQSGIGKRVLKNLKYIDKGTHAEFDNVFSVPFLPDTIKAEQNHAEVFEVCEDGARFIYASFRFMPAITRNTYFVRIPSLLSGPLLKIDYKKKRLQKFFDFSCGQ